MGLPLSMNNLHAPTIPSGPTTARAANGGSAHLTFTELQRKKENMEEELKALSSVLDSHGVDMNTSLLTPDGFPRADLDVAQSMKHALSILSWLPRAGSQANDTSTSQSAPPEHGSYTCATTTKT